MMMDRPTLSRIIGVATMVVIASTSLWLPEYYLGILIRTLIFTSLALAWNIVGGIGGQLSLGHSVFIGLGALLPAALALKMGVNLWFGMMAAAAVSAVLGAAMAWTTFRFRLGHLYFALVTLAFGELGRIIVIGTDFLGGASGLLLPRAPADFWKFSFETSSQYLLLALALVVLAFVTTDAVVHSKLGYRLRAIRNNEDAAQAVGIDLLKTKTMAMILSAILSSFGGSIFARYNGFVDPEVFASPMIVISIIMFTAIGGIGTLWGPVVGVGLFYPLGEILRGSMSTTLPGLHFVVFGVLLVLVIRLMPSGVIGLLGKRFKFLLRIEAA
jgi:branched-chain amino acid transport system permease protein